MYSESIVNQRISIAQEELGYQLVYHSTAEVDTFIAHLNASTKLDAAGKPFFSRDLTQSEFRFIENEKILCQSDAAYWLTRYGWVTDESTNAVRFKFRGAQPILFSVISDLESKHSAVEILIAKARQQYITTLTQLLVFHRVLYYHYTYGVVASADASKSEEMSEKAFFAYDQLPWWLKPKYSRRVEGVPGLMKFDTIASRIRILHGATSAKAKGAQKVGIARGSTPTCYAISEVAHFPDPEQTIEAALWGGVHANPKTMGFLESTFAGDKDWFAKRYKESKELYDKGLARCRSIFFPWIFAREIYPTPTWWATNRRHMPHDWTPLTCECGYCERKPAAQIAKTELYIRNTPLLTAALGPNWTMPIEQQWYYHFRYTEAMRNGTLATLQQEFACDDIEAMVSSFDNVFGRETIELAHETREKRFDVYGFAGQAIDDQFEPHPDDIDPNRSPLVFNHKTPKGDTYRWELIPLKYDLFAEATGDEHERPAIDNKLFIYRQPEPGFDYSIGGDSATGSGSDACVFNVNRVGKAGTPDIQAAEFRSHLVNHVEFFAFIFPVALHYRSANPQLDLFSWPKIAVEQIASVGDVCMRELVKLGYPVGRAHRMGRYDSKQPKRELNMIGWGTTGWSRPILLGHFVHAVKNSYYDLNSPWTIEECRQFEKHSKDSGKVKLEHSSDSWDDGIFASAISYFIVHDMDSLAERSKKQVHGTERGSILPPIDIEPYAGNLYNPNTRQSTLEQVLSERLDRFRH